MGDGSLVMMGEGQSVELALIDFGVHPRTDFKVGADDAMTFLTRTIAETSSNRQTDFPYLDHLFLTHGDIDHYNRVWALVNSDFGTYAEEFDGMQLQIGTLTFGGRESEYNGLINSLRGVTTTVEVLGDAAHAEINEDGTVEPSWIFADGGVYVYLLSANYPRRDTGAKNAKSLCLMFEDGSVNRMIFMGDAEELVETAIIETFSEAEDGFLGAYGLKLGHHGSMKGTSQEWLNVVNPRAVFASGDFVWSHPYCPTITRVINHGSLFSEEETHWYCCSDQSTKKEKGDYNNNDTLVQVFINLWYVVKDIPDVVDAEDNGQMMIDEEDEQENWAASGTTYGVQWAMDFDGDEAPTFAHTDTSIPVEDTID
jgi:competence protein ComEC